MRTNRIIDATVDEVEEAKLTAVELSGGRNSDGVLDLFYSDSLDDVENGIRRLNEMSSVSWLLSALLLYTLVYNQDLYRQSGLDWAQYSAQARKRLGMEKRDVTEQLSAARFFIKNHKSLVKAGWKVNGSIRKLARAEFAVELSGSVEQTIRHIVSDTWSDFNAWYSSFKVLPAPSGISRNDIDVKGFKIRGVEAVKISEELPAEDRRKVYGYIEKIFQILRNGDEPAIIDVYDKKEAARLERLRDKARGER